MSGLGGAIGAISSISSILKSINGMISFIKKLFHKSPVKEFKKGEQRADEKLDKAAKEDDTSNFFD